MHCEVSPNDIRWLSLSLRVASSTSSREPHACTGTCLGDSPSLCADGRIYCYSSPCIYACTVIFFLESISAELPYPSRLYRVPENLPLAALRDHGSTRGSRVNNYRVLTRKHSVQTFVKIVAFYSDFGTVYTCPTYLLKTDISLTHSADRQ